MRCKEWPNTTVQQGSLLWWNPSCLTAHMMRQTQDSDSLLFNERETPVAVGPWTTEVRRDRESRANSLPELYSDLVVATATGVLLLWTFLCLPGQRLQTSACSLWNRATGACCWTGWQGGNYQNTSPIYLPHLTALTREGRESVNYNDILVLAPTTLKWHRHRSFTLDLTKGFKAFWHLFGWIEDAAFCKSSSGRNLLALG